MDKNINDFNMPKTKTRFKFKENFNKFKVYIIAGAVSVIGALSFILAPVSIGLISLTPIVPVLTGSALSILAFRQFAPQSEIKKGKNANTSIGTGYTHILMCSIVFTTLGFMGTLLGPATAFVIPTWYACIAVCAISALSAGGYEKLSEDWKKSPLSILRGLLEVIDFVSLLIPFRATLKNAFGELHNHLGNIFFRLEMGLFVAFIFLGGPLLPIGVAGLTVTALNFARARSYFPVKFGTFLEKSFAWFGVCAGLFIDNPVLRVYTIYTFASMLLLKIGSYLGSRFFGLEINTNVNTKDNNTLEDSNEKDITKKITWKNLSLKDLDSIFTQIPDFQSQKELVCRNEPNDLVELLSDDQLSAKYESIYRGEAYRLQQDNAKRFEQLRSSRNIFDRFLFYLLIIPKQIISITDIPKPLMSKKAYITKQRNDDKERKRQLQEASTDTDIDNLIHEYLKFQQNAYNEKITQYGFEYSKNRSLAEIIKNYINYIPWYISRPNENVKVLKQFINDKIQSNNFAINSAHVEYIPELIPLTGNIQTFNPDETVEKILKLFPKYHHFSFEHISDTTELNNKLKELQNYQDLINILEFFSRVLGDVEVKSFYTDLIKVVTSGEDAITLINDITNVIRNQYNKIDQTILSSNDTRLFFGAKLINIAKRLQMIRTSLNDDTNEDQFLVIIKNNKSDCEKSIFTRESPQGLYELFTNKIKSLVEEYKQTFVQEDKDAYALITELHNSLNNMPVGNINELLEKIAEINKHINNIEKIRNHKYPEKNRAIFEKRLSEIIHNIKTGSDFGMDKSVNSVLIIQKMAIETIETILNLSKNSNNTLEEDLTSQTFTRSHFENIVVETYGKCAQALFTIILELYNNHVIGPKIKQKVKNKQYSIKDILAYNLRFIREQHVDNIIKIAAKHPLFRSVFFMLDPNDHHDYVSMKLALQNIYKLNYYSELDHDLSTTNIDVLKEAAIQTFATLVDWTFKASHTLYSPSGIINFMYEKLIEDIKNSNQDMFFNPGSIPKEYNTLSCLELWVEEKQNKDLSEILNDIKRQVMGCRDSYAIENELNEIKNPQKEAQEELHQKIRKILCCMLLDTEVINFTETGINASILTRTPILNETIFDEKSEKEIINYKNMYDSRSNSAFGSTASLTTEDPNMIAENNSPSYKR